MNPQFFFSKSLAIFQMFCVVALCGGSQPAAAQEAMELKTEAFQDVLVKDKEGKTQKKRKALVKAVPGDEVIYVITYRNTGDKPAENVVVNNPVPVGLSYVPGSAVGEGVRAEVSVDKGKQFGALETLRVKAANGALRAAKAEDVTHVRWTLLSAVPPAASGSVTYKALLK
ncbi:MAG: hypothetical protein ACKVP2_08715 [Burkholderiales bacterium]